jgi:two-component system, NarL family, response regulator
MAKDSAISLLIIDDHSLFREGLARMLDSETGFSVVAQSDGGENAEDLWDRHRPDVTLIDISMPGIGGIESVKRIKSRHVAAKLLMLTSSDERSDIIGALDAGADGYVTKTIRYTDLLMAIKEVHGGGQPIGESIARILAERAKKCPLSAREHEVLVLLKEGYTLSQIGKELSVTERTIRSHVAFIKAKLGAANTAQAVAEAFKQGILK